MPFPWLNPECGVQKRTGSKVSSGSQTFEQLLRTRHVKKGEQPWRVVHAKRIRAVVLVAL